jgi:hypothetical protein
MGGGGQPKIPGLFSASVWGQISWAILAESRYDPSDFPRLYTSDFRSWAARFREIDWADRT